MPWPHDAPSPTLVTGDLIGDYRIEAVLGSSRFGTVYRAAHARLGMVVALRVARPQGAAAQEVRARLVRDSLAVAALRHPGFLPILQAGEDGDSCLVAMAFIEHDTLLDMVVRAGGIPAPDVLPIIARVGEALDALHGRGLQHGRLCARRVLVSGRRPYVGGVGFGQRGPWDFRADRLDELDGVAPEQIDGRRIEARTDVYALGCLLVRSITGSAPFPAHTADEMLRAHLSAPPPELEGSAAGLTRDLDEVIATALAKEPNDRYESCSELVVAVTGALGLTGRVGAETRGPDATVRTLDETAPAARAAYAAGPAADVVARGAAGATSQQDAEQPVAADAMLIPPDDSRPAGAPHPAEVAADGSPGVADSDGVATDGSPQVADTDGVATDGSPGVADTNGVATDGSPDVAGADSYAPPPDDAQEFVASSTSNADGSGAVDEVVAQGAADDRQIPGDEEDGGSAGAGSHPLPDSSAARPSGDRKAGKRPRSARILAMVLGLLAALAVAAIAVAVTRDEPADEASQPAAKRPAAERPAAVVPLPAPAVRAGAPVGVGERPTALALTDGGAWVADGDADALISVNEAGEVTPADVPVPVGDNPAALTFGAGGLWVANAGAGTVTRVDPSRRSVVGEPIPVGAEPSAVALGTRSVWVANRGDATLSRIDRSANAVTDAPISVGAEPTAVATTEDYVWVANAGDDTVSRIDVADPGAAQSPIAVGGRPVALTVGARTLWVANARAGTVSRISVRRGRLLGDPIRVGGQPVALAFGAGYVWVADAAGRRIQRLRPRDGRLAGDPIALQGRPSRIRLEPEALWVLSSADRSLSRIPLTP